MLMKFYKKFIADDNWVASSIILLSILIIVVIAVDALNTIYKDGYNKGKEDTYEEIYSHNTTTQTTTNTEKEIVTISPTSTIKNETTTSHPIIEVETTTITTPYNSTTTTEIISTYRDSSEIEVIDGFMNLGQFKLTAYCSCSRCCGSYAYNRPLDENGEPIVYTASGAIAESGKTIAVDPSIIPYGTEVIINGNTYIAQDCGGAIKSNRIDVYFDNHAEASQFGVQYADVYVKGGV